MKDRLCHFVFPVLSLSPKHVMPCLFQTLPPWYFGHSKSLHSHFLARHHAAVCVCPTRWRWDKLSRRQAVCSVSSHHTTHLPALSAANTNLTSPPRLSQRYSRPTHGRGGGISWHSAESQCHFTGLKGPKTDSRHHQSHEIMRKPQINKKESGLRSGSLLFGDTLCNNLPHWPDNVVLLHPRRKLVNLHISKSHLEIQDI